MAAPNTWIAETTRTFIGNAASRKDFRVQMRGSKPFWVFSLYVLALTLVGITDYWSTLGRTGLSIASAQRELTEFFTSLMVTLGAAVCIIAPCLTGSAIVSEKQRLSLDLVLSAPIEPKYFLVGKMISSYRYIWMLLILALPVVAMSVVLGGATWKDVFGCFVLLSFHATIFTSLGLLISSVTAKPASAVIWSLLAVGGYVIVASSIFGVALSGAGGMFGSGTSSHVPFIVALNPFLPLEAINSTTLIGSWEAPNWIFGILMALLLTRLFLLGAAVNLAPLDKRLAANLRISGIVYIFGLALLVTYSLGSLLKMTTTSSSISLDILLTIVALACVAWLVFAIPYFSCYANDASRRFKLNGRFSVRHIFDGTPAGNLPYVLALVAASYAGVLFGALINGVHRVGASFEQALLWPIGFAVLSWSIGQLISAARRNLKTARVLTLVVMITPPFIFPLIMVIMRLEQPWTHSTEASTSAIWYLWPFAPLIDATLFASAWVYGLVMLALGLILTIWARSIESRKSLVRLDV